MLYTLSHPQHIFSSKERWFSRFFSPANNLTSFVWKDVCCFHLMSVYSWRVKCNVGFLKRASNDNIYILPSSFKIESFCLNIDFMYNFYFQVSYLWYLNSFDLSGRRTKYECLYSGQVAWAVSLFLMTCVFFLVFVNLIMRTCCYIF